MSVEVASYAGAMEALRHPDLMQGLYDAGMSVMADALITLHGESHSQRRVVEFGVFGRGFYVLDDFSPLRSVSEELLQREAALFGVRDALLYVPARPLGASGAGFQGAAFYTADNPPFGALLTYHLKEGLKTLKEQRKEAEKKADAVEYPALEKFREESLEPTPRITLTISDENGREVRRLEGPVAQGFHRVSWDLRHAGAQPAADPDNDEDGPPGPLVLPGSYTAKLFKTVGGETVELDGPQRFRVKALGVSEMSVEARGELEAFQKRLALLRGAVEGALESAASAQDRLGRIDLALREFPAADPELPARARRLTDELTDLLIPLRGDPVVRSYGSPPPPSIRSSVLQIVDDQRFSTSPPTNTHRRQYQQVGEAFSSVLVRLKRLIDEDLAALEADLDEAGVPWTPGRLPVWPPR